MFTIGQWNILCERFALPRNFPYVRPSLLHWPSRRRAVLRHMYSFSSSFAPAGWDFFCLQEASDFWPFFQPLLERRFGFRSLFLPRPITNVSPSTTCLQDGTAVMYNAHRWRLSRSLSLAYRGSGAYDRVGLAVLFHHRRPPHPAVIVASTHVFWDTTGTAEQLAEVRTLLSAVHCLRAEEPRAQVVLAADLNSTEDGVGFRYLREAGRLLPVYERGGLSTYNFHRRNRIDHIMHSDGLRRVRVLEAPPVEVLRGDDGPEGWVQMENARRRAAGERELDENENCNGIPNRRIPSDHLPIAAELEFVPQ